MQEASLTLKLNGPEPDSPTAIFYQGQGFFLAASRCLLTIDVGPGVRQCLVSPGVVNLCLAIELFLKSLHVVAGKQPPKTHKLVDLLAELPASDIESLRRSYAQQVAEPTFDELLRQVNEYFVKLRYEYEFDVFNYQETPVYHLASVAYEHSARAHGIKVGIEAIRL